VGGEVVLEVGPEPGESGGEDASVGLGERSTRRPRGRGLVAAGVRDALDQSLTSAATKVVGGFGGW
jgi:hypothetical protein